MDDLATVGDALRRGAERLALREDLRVTARQDAQQLLEIATGLSRVQMLARPGAQLGPDESARYEDLLQQRLSATPIQYLRGSQEFYGRSFLVTPSVLIPRPETEDIVGAVLEHVADRQATLRIADAGTGTGALAITLALELPNCTVRALDISPAALEVAKQNLQRLAQEHDRTAGDRVHLYESDLFAALSPEQRFDIVVSNPPYIPLSEREDLHPQVRDHEPALALFSGEDGHDLYRRLIPEAWERLLPGGLLAMETAGRADLLHSMLSSWSEVRFRADLRGLPRTVLAVKP